MNYLYILLISVWRAWASSSCLDKALERLAQIDRDTRASITRLGMKRQMVDSAKKSLDKLNQRLEVYASIVHKAQENSKRGGAMFFGNPQEANPFAEADSFLVNIQSKVLSIPTNELRDLLIEKYHDEFESRQSGEIVKFFSELMETLKEISARTSETVLEYQSGSDAASLYLTRLKAESEDLMRNALWLAEIDMDLCSDGQQKERIENIILTLRTRLRLV
jgi:hypothetical protein